MNRDNPYDSQNSDLSSSGAGDLGGRLLWWSIVAVFGCGGLGGLIGMGIGAALGSILPSYYRSVFASGNDPGFDPVAVGIGQGLTQGVVFGAVVGMILVALHYWHRSGKTDRQSRSP